MRCIVGLAATIALLNFTSESRAASASNTVNFSGDTIDAPNGVFGDFTIRSFDVGQEFLSIDSVIVELSGTGFEGEADIGFNNETRNFGPEVTVSIGSQSATENAFFSGTRTLSFNSGTFSDLLDGAGDLSLTIDGPNFVFNDVFVNAQFQPTTALIRINGTFVPEPTSALMLSLAVLWLRRR